MEAVKREVREEVGFLPSQYDLVESRGGYRYDYPPEVLDYVREKRQQSFVRQEQEYFLCRLHADAPEPSFKRFRLKWLLEVQERGMGENADGFFQ